VAVAMLGPSELEEYFVMQCDVRINKEFLEKRKIIIFTF
ncbi:hypothetical protein THOM_3157, partial [Trachipleistophora hominis]